MNGNNYLTPGEIAESTVQIGIKKAKSKGVHLLLLGFMAGAFIAFASEGSNMAAYNLLAKPETYGLGKCLAGAIFGTGLMMVVIAGAELFTGNNLMLLAKLEGRIGWPQLLRNWVLV
jgi:formate/nitrite transporter FocA (FNT family)